MRSRCDLVLAQVALDVDSTEIPPAVFTVISIDSAGGHNKSTVSRM